MLKLAALALLLVGQINACCLPESFQITMLTDTHYGERHRFRARIVMAADAASGRAAIFSASENGHVGQLYADFRANRAYAYAPGFGCYESPLPERLIQQFNESRCVPRNILEQSPISINIAQRVNASLFSGRIGNTTLDALVSDHCEPILVKVKGPGFKSVSIFGDIQHEPQPGFLEPPAECRNATVVGGRKRGLVTLGYGASPFAV